MAVSSDSGPKRTGLTADLFYADTDHEAGDDNVTIAGFDVQPYVFFVSAAVIIAFIIYTLAVPEDVGVFGLTIPGAEGLIGDINSWITTNFGWFYILAANIFIFVVLFLGFSKYGKIRIGGVDAEKEFSDLSWVAMLFSAGMGIGLMFFSVAEPMWHMADPLFGVEGGTAEAGDVALAISYFHWAFHPWAIYGIVGLALAFFSYNRGLPLTIRSVFWPILGDRIYGWWGHLIDILAVFATLFGLATSLGLGAQQVGAGVSFLGEETVGASIPQGDLTFVAIIAVITGIAMVSVYLGIHKGIRRLSNFNVALMFSLMIAVLIVGPTLFLLGVIPQATGTYLQNLPELAFWTESFDGGPYEGWQGAWTVFYWAWWIAWSPFVGLFIARISYGRTVREFVAGVLVIPVIFSFLFIGVMGGAGIEAELAGQPMLDTLFAEGADEADAMFALFAVLPLTEILSVAAVVLVTTFFVTSSDSGSLVLGHLSSGGKQEAPRNQRLTWAFLEGAVAAVLLIGGGLQALQTASIAAGLPFAVVLLFMSYSVWQGLSEEYETLESEEFSQLVDRLVEERDIVVKKTGTSVVTGIDETESETVSDGSDPQPVPDESGSVSED